MVTSHDASQNDMPAADVEVDATGLRCPLPILRAKKALATMDSGQILKIIATDPGSRQDFAAFAQHTGNTIIDLREHGDGFVFWLQRR